MIIGSTRYFLPTDDSDPYKIDISMWNRHADPIYGMTRSSVNSTTQQVVVEYAAVEFIDVSETFWFRDDGRMSTFYHTIA